MLKHITLAISCFVLATMAQAQDVCTIKGRIANDSLRYDGKRIAKVYLTQIDEFDRPMAIDSVKIKKGTFQFKRKLPKGTPSMLYQITGFDNGTVNLFVEPGTVNVQIDKAAYPSGADVCGTPTNELYKQYNQIKARCTKEQNDTLAALRQSGADVEKLMNSAEGFQWWQRIGAAALIDCNADRIKFLLDHNDSPLAPLMMEKEIYYMLDKAYAQKLFDALSPRLKGHPYYRSYGNVVKALDLQKGSELPDITLPLADGTIRHLSDYRGKYVLLDFWASWCGPCRKEMPHLVQLFDETQASRDKFTVISFSIDDKRDAWQKAVANLNLNKEGWVHASDLLGWASPAARFLGVTAVPRTILIDPEGRAIAFDLRGEDMIRRVKRILGGDLYYQNDK